mmetsp:Transcript_62095/g.173407  ORF Transcript_62095/g.173407 Transcript_62095/m.173407 type:complete len:376 (+) Transcript_62095:311-1438(+)
MPATSKKSPARFAGQLCTQLRCGPRQLAVDVVAPPLRPLGAGGADVGNAVQNGLPPDNGVLEVQHKGLAVHEGLQRAALLLDLRLAVDHSAVGMPAGAQQRPRLLPSKCRHRVCRLRTGLHLPLRLLPALRRYGAEVPRRLGAVAARLALQRRWRDAHAIAAAQERGARGGDLYLLTRPRRWRHDIHRARHRRRAAAAGPLKGRRHPHDAARGRRVPGARGRFWQRRRCTLAEGVRHAAGPGAQPLPFRARALVVAVPVALSGPLRAERAFGCKVRWRRIGPRDLDGDGRSVHVGLGALHLMGAAGGLARLEEARRGCERSRRPLPQQLRRQAAGAVGERERRAPRPWAAASVAGGGQQRHDEGPARPAQSPAHA